MLDLLLLAVVIIFIFATGYRPEWWVSGKITRALRDIPGPLAVPLFGTRWMYYTRWFGGWNLDSVPECYAYLFKKHGSIICERALWNIPVVSICNRSDIETVLRLQNAERYPFRPATEVVVHYRSSRPDRYASTGLVNEQGERWFHLRSALTAPLTNTKVLGHFRVESEMIVDDFVALLRSIRKRNIVSNFDALANRFGLESTCALVLGRRMGFLLESDSGDLNRTATVLENAVREHFCASRDTFYGLPWWKLWKTNAYKRYAESEDTIYNIVSEMVDEAIEDHREMDTDVFTSICNAQGIDVREKKATLIDFIAAGIHTLGNTLVFLLDLIGRNRNAQNRLRAELYENDKDDSPYLRACIMECYRLLPTAHCLARILTSDTMLSEYLVPAGTVVLCHTAIACRNSDYFADADQFRPERWLSNVDAQSLVLPFGIGRRICPGKRFVQQQLRIVLAKIVREFDIEVIDPEQPLELKFEFLVAPKGPVHIILNDRS